MSIKQIMRLIYAIPLAVISYPIFVLAMSIFGVTIFFGLIGVVGSVITYPISKGEDLYESSYLVWAPFVVPLVLWYEWIKTGK